MAVKKILLVDDKAMLRDALIEYLGSEDFQIIEAEDGEKALSLYKTEDIDVVILDHNLPGIDGYKTLKMMKQLKPAIPVIGLTGELTIDIREKYLEMGAFDIHAKSAIYEKLIPTLKAALQGKQIAPVSQKPDYLQLADKLKNEGRWEESALYMKEAGLEQKAAGNTDQANEFFQEAIQRYIRAGRRTKAVEVEKMMAS
jgi:DNA-binding response OmpR family regulator